MASVSFMDWWVTHPRTYWKWYNGMTVSLGEDAINIYDQVLKLLNKLPDQGLVAETCLTISTYMMGRVWFLGLEFLKESVCGLHTLPSLQMWVSHVRNPDLVVVKDFKRRLTDPLPANEVNYQMEEGLIVFFRNAGGHVHDNKAHSRPLVYLDDAAIILMLENDLPFAIPTWYRSLFVCLDLRHALCVISYADLLWESLSKNPSLFVREIEETKFVESGDFAEYDKKG